MITLTAPPARVLIDPERGGRIASFQVHGRELLVTAEQAVELAGGRNPDPMAWGCYPMVPWAGRVRRGRFTFVQGTYQLPINHAPHAIHGTGFTQPWQVRDDGSLRVDLGASWPFGGYAIQRFALTSTSFTATIELHNDELFMPAQVGWHPWFRRPVSLMFAARQMYLRDADGIPTGETTSPPSGPWDDCFTDLVASPRLSWQGGLSMIITSSCDHWVIYDEPRHALCVEPQSGPPDAFNLAPRFAGPLSPQIETMTWTWG